jgi:23S rRNA (cytidine1920-2'-O)/16S rRNA (cytidine1409-2'-O)-methyltransferase
LKQGRESVGKKGIVRDPLVHKAVLERHHPVCGSLKDILPKGLSFSPITGGDGNIEFLLHLHWDGEGPERQELRKKTINRVVEEAHKTLKAKKPDQRD